MAITVHSAGQQTTANDSSASNNQNVTLAAGSNRRLFVCVQVEHAGGDEGEGISAITYGGNALTQVTDGADPALIDLSVAHIEWFQLLEADMPANGSQALNVTLTVSRQCTVGWIILEGCDQNTNVEFTNFEGATTTATSLTINGFDVPDEGFAILVGWYSNQTGGTTPNHSCTIDGDAATERWDAFNGQGGAFMSGYTRVLTTETGTIPAVLTCDSSNRRCGAGFAVAPAAAASPVNVSGGFTLGAVTTAGGVLVVPVELSGGFSTAPVLLDATGDTLLAVSGALATAGVTGAIAAEVMVGISGGFTLGAVSVSGTVLPQREISGGFTLGAVTTAGLVSSDQNADISGGFSIGAVAVAGALTVEVAISGGFTLGAATVAGEVDLPVAISGGVELAPAEVAGDVTFAKFISGGFTLGAVTTAGLVSHERELGGGFATPAVELSAAGDTMIAISGGFSIGAVQLAGGVVHADVPGSVLIADRAYGSVSIFDERSGSVIIQDRQRDA